MESTQGPGAGTPLPLPEPPQLHGQGPSPGFSTTAWAGTRPEGQRLDGQTGHVEARTGRTGVRPGARAGQTDRQRGAGCGERRGSAGWQQEPPAAPWVGRAGSRGRPGDRQACPSPSTMAVSLPVAPRSGQEPPGAACWDARQRLDPAEGSTGIGPGRCPNRLAGGAAIQQPGLTWSTCQPGGQMGMEGESL